MAKERLPTNLWVKAHVRLCDVNCIPISVVRRGDPHSGTVIIKLNQLEKGCLVMSQASNIFGQIGWFKALDGILMSDIEANNYIARQIDRDPDLWVIEIEDSQGRNWVDGDLIF